MINLNEASVLEFSMSIHNSPNKLDKATLFIECGGFDIALPIVVEGDEKAKVHVPVLEHIVSAGKHDIRMEMVLGGQVYTAFKDKMDFNAPPSIKVENTQISIAPAASIEVKPFNHFTPMNAKSETVIVEERVEETHQSKFGLEFAKLLQSALETNNKEM